MSKFKAGDEVVCIDNLDAEDSLIEHAHYSIISIKNYGGNDYEYILDEPSGMSWREERFELVNENVYTNGAYDTVVQASYLLRKAASALEDCHNYQLAEEINKFLGEE